jgi:uncharacterized membrane protein YoaK (UPF0700 family)
LAACAGCVDALAYLRLGNVFTANMTGNTVLVAIALGQRHAEHVARSALAIAGFCVGASVVSVVASAAWGLALEIALLIATAFLAAGGGVAAGFPAIASAGVAMGCQAGTIRRRNRTRVNATYITGTVTELVTRFTDRMLGRDSQPERGGARLPAAVWAGYAVGGVGGAVLAVPVGAASFAIAAVPVATVLLVHGVARAAGYRQARGLQIGASGQGVSRRGGCDHRR